MICLFNKKTKNTNFNYIGKMTMKTVSFVKAVLVSLVLFTGTILPGTNIIDRDPKPLESTRAISARVIYPELARKCRIQGTVKVTVTVDQDGNVTEARVKRGNGIGFGCDEAAIEAAKSMHFTPLNDGTTKVTDQLTVPFIFKL
jgi:TonB family protein